MASENFKLLIITSETGIPKETESIIQLFEEGLELLHIRKPSYPLEEIRSLIESIPSKFHSKIVIHSHYALLHEFSLKGLHLPEKIRKEVHTNEIENIVSTSFHTLEDIVVEKRNFEYAFFSPVFPSISKKGYVPSLQLKSLKYFFDSNKSQIMFPIIALGGINDSTIIQARDIGFAGAACIGYIWGGDKPIKQLQKLQAILKG